MCGVTGILAPSELLDRSPLDDMVDALTHRGPDDRGVWVDHGAGVALGHRRLAIRDLSPTGHQPMVSASGETIVAFNGEIYNADVIRRDLESLGHQFRGSSDTEVLLEGIDRWGLRETVDRCVGMFAIAVWDSRTQQLTLVRDRLGIKPLYWGKLADGSVVFGSELKALQAHPRFDPSIDSASVAAYLRCSYVPGPRSIWASCWKVKPGHMLALQFGNGRLRVEETRYWDLKDHVVSSERDFDATDAIERLHALLRQAVGQRLVSDVPLGVLLSGGIDSSLVAAIAAEQASGAIRTFSAGFEDGRLDESVHAARVAQAIGSDHTQLVVTESDALNVVPQLATMYDEPFGDSSQIPTHLVCALARQHVTVALSGDGGDETFGGYHIYGRLHQLARTARRIPHALRRLIDAATSLTPSLALGAVARVLSAGRGRVDAKQLRTATRMLSLIPSDAAHAWAMSSRTDVSVAMIDPPDAGCTIEAAAARLECPDLVERAMFADSETYLIDDILTKVDRASMACSLEARVPLLDHRVVEYAWRTPVAWRRRDGVAKWPLRQLLGQYVPKDLWDRPKQGFGAPIQAWLRGPLREWGHALCTSDLSERVGIKPAFARKTWAALVRGDRRAVRPTWTILMLLAWADRSESR
ncbi:MAG: asparagine synthase (glutamine-hydrolyzing) [Phycisphaerales bacterium]|nr:asparagine synthase (glutamine-hydrolyzing) [Phycisphaerales bacterium]